MSKQELKPKTMQEMLDTVKYTYDTLENNAEHLVRENEALQEEVKRYREALEFNLPRLIALEKELDGGTYRGAEVGNIYRNLNEALQEEIKLLKEPEVYGRSPELEPLREMLEENKRYREALDKISLNYTHSKPEGTPRDWAIEALNKGDK